MSTPICQDIESVPCGLCMETEAKCFWCEKYLPIAIEALWEAHDSGAKYAKTKKFIPGELGVHVRYAYAWSERNSESKKTIVTVAPDDTIHLAKSLYKSLCRKFDKEVSSPSLTRSSKHHATIRFSNESNLGRALTDTFANERELLVLIVNAKSFTAWDSIPEHAHVMGLQT